MHKDALALNREGLGANPSGKVSHVQPTSVFHFLRTAVKTLYSWSISFMAFFGQVCCPMRTKSFTTAKPQKY